MRLQLDRKDIENAIRDYVDNTLGLDGEKVKIVQGKTATAVVVLEPIVDRGEIDGEEA